MKFQLGDYQLSLEKPSPGFSFSDFLKENLSLFLPGIENCKKIYVKINLPFWETPPGSLTSKSSLLDLCEFLVLRFPSKPLKIVESRYGWVPHKVFQEYRIEESMVQDLFELPHYSIPALSFDRRKRNLHISKIVKEPGSFIITLGPPKTHEHVMYTGAIKTLMGFLHSKKRHMHGFSNLNCFNDKSKWVKMVVCLHLNLIKLYQEIRPNISILDGTSCQEGNSPVFGSLVHWDFWGISNDALALDYVTASLMGFVPDDIAYLELSMRKRERELKAWLAHIVFQAEKMGLFRGFMPHANYPECFDVSQDVIKMGKEALTKCKP